MAQRIPLVLEYEDGHLEEVVSDQRDFAAFEGAERRSVADAQKETPLYVYRFLAYSVQKRAGAVKTQDEFDKAVVDVAVGRLAEVEPPVPGGPEATAETSSSSPLRRVRASGRSSSGGSQKTS